MAGNYQKSWQMEVGLNNVGSYQVSGQPFASGGIDATAAYKVSFPYTTRWVEITNYGSTALKVGFSQHGVRADNRWTGTLAYPAGTNYFRVGSMSGSVRLELKVAEIWLSGSNSVDVVAGLTSIKGDRTTTDTGPSWSGSSGVG